LPPGRTVNTRQSVWGGVRPLLCGSPLLYPAAAVSSFPRSTDRRDSNRSSVSPDGTCHLTNRCTGRRTRLSSVLHREQHGRQALAPVSLVVRLHVQQSRRAGCSAPAVRYDALKNERPRRPIPRLVSASECRYLLQPSREIESGELIHEESGTCHQAEPSTLVRVSGAECGLSAAAVLSQIRRPRSHHSLVQQTGATAIDRQSVPTVRAT